MITPIDLVARRGRSALRLAHGLVRNRFSRLNAAPVFLLGNQKSGTTAVGAVLGDITGLTVTLDLVREVVDPSFARVRDGTLTMDDLVRRNRYEFSRDIVKEPHLTMFHDDLRRTFPAARFALVVRDPRDNIRSILDRLGVPGDDPERAVAMRHRNDRGWRLVIDGRWLGVEAATTLEHLAHRWNICADVHLRHPEDVVLVRYEDFVADKYGATAQLARAMGLDVAKPEVDRDVAGRAHQPPGRHGGVDARQFFGNANLAVIEDICGERMAKLGYSTITAGPA